MLDPGSYRCSDRNRGLTFSGPYQRGSSSGVRTSGVKPDIKQRSSSRGSRFHTATPMSAQLARSDWVCRDAAWECGHEALRRAHLGRRIGWEPGGGKPGPASSRQPRLHRSLREWDHRARNAQDFALRHVGPASDRAGDTPLPRGRLHACGAARGTRLAGRLGKGERTGRGRECGDHAAPGPRREQADMDCPQQSH